MANKQADTSIGMDDANLYKEETVTDRRVGTLQKLIPVTANGEIDTKRNVVYVGQTQVLTPGGALPLSFEIDARSLEEAVAKFGQYAQNALNDAVQRLEEMRREAASSLIVPGAGGAGPMGSGGRGGIQIP
jgi:hypothetical protein